MSKKPKSEEEEPAMPAVASKPEISAVDDPLISLSEVSRMCNKSVTTIKRWCNDGLLRFRRMPSGLFVIRTSEVEKFIGGSGLKD